MKAELKKILFYISEEGKFALVVGRINPEEYPVEGIEKAEGGVCALGGEKFDFGTEGSILINATTRTVGLASLNKVVEWQLFDDFMPLKSLFTGRDVILLLSPVVLKEQSYYSIDAFAPFLDDDLDCACWLRYLNRWLDKQPVSTQERSREIVAQMSKLAKFLYRNHLKKKKSPFLEGLE